MEIEYFILYIYIYKCIVLNCLNMSGSFLSCVHASRGNTSNNLLLVKFFKSFRLGHLEDYGFFKTNFENVKILNSWVLFQYLTIYRYCLFGFIIMLRANSYWKLSMYEIYLIWSLGYPSKVDALLKGKLKFREMKKLVQDFLEVSKPRLRL